MKHTEKYFTKFHDSDASRLLRPSAIFTYMQETANMQWPEWIYGAFVPIGAAFAAIAFFQTMLVMCKEYKEQEGEK